MPIAEKLTDGQKRARLQDTINAFEKSGGKTIHPSRDSSLTDRDLVELLSLKNPSDNLSLFQELLIEINNNKKLNIDEVNLEGFISHDAPLRQMVPIIAESKKIKKLILSYNNLAWEGAEEKLINLFTQNKSISHLDISKTEIKGETLIKILEKNQLITNIKFDHGTNFITSKQADIIEEKLKARQKSEEKSDTGPKQEPSTLAKSATVSPLNKTPKSNIPTL